MVSGRRRWLTVAVVVIVAVSCSLATSKYNYRIASNVIMLLLAAVDSKQYCKQHECHEVPTSKSWEDPEVRRKIYLLHVTQAARDLDVFVQHYGWMVRRKVGCTIHN